MSFNCFQLILISVCFASLNFNGKCDAKPHHHRHHKHDWMVAAIPTDSHEDNDEFQTAINEFVNRVEPELSIDDDVFDLSKEKTTDAPIAIAETAEKQLEDVQVSAHPYMQTLYAEIDEKRNEKWAEIVQPGAIIRGIEPIKVTNSKIADSIDLEFSIGTIKDLNAILHVDLVLTSSAFDDSNESDDDENRKEFTVHLQGQNKNSASMKLKAYRKLASSDSNWSYLVLEMTPTIRHWWNKGHLKSTQTIHLSPSSIDLQQPILVFYYVSKNANKDKSSRKKRSINVRPCSNRCVHAQRRQASANTINESSYRFCSLRSWDVTIQDLQWEAKVVAPNSLKMDYCSGSCEAPIYDSSYNATNHAVVRSVLLTQTANRNATDSFPPPYCVPTTLESHTFLFSENGQYYIKPMDNITARQCGCR